MAGHYTSHAAGFPHSDTLGSPSVHQLPEAYRRSPRPSSAPDTKASTMRSYTLTTLKRAANQITHNNKQSRRSFIRCSRPLFTNKNNNKKNTQQSVPPQPNNVPTRTLHAPSKEHTTHAHNTPQKAHHESFCDVPPKNKHHTQTRVAYPPNNGWLLLRKEVIQPHLPVRLPCYDLVPITSPTFDGSPHTG